MQCWHMVLLAADAKLDFPNFSVELSDGLSMVATTCYVAHLTLDPSR